MRSEAPALLPILRSRHLAEILTLLLPRPDTEYSLSELAATLGLPLTTVQREAARLGQQGLRPATAGGHKAVAGAIRARCRAIGLAGCQGHPALGRCPQDPGPPGHPG
jgi:hypothetical protein